MIILLFILFSGTVYLGLKLIRLLRSLNNPSRLSTDNLITERKKSVMKVKIAAAKIMNKEVSPAEGSVQIKALLNNLYLDRQGIMLFKPFTELAEAAGHLPLGEARQKYSPQDLAAYDEELKKIENTYASAVMKAAEKITEHHFEL